MVTSWEFFFFHLGQVDYKLWVWVVKRSPPDQMSYVHQYTTECITLTFPDVKPSLAVAVS